MTSPDPSTRETIIPLHTEDVSVTRRAVPGDTVRVEVVTEAREQLVDEPVFHEQVQIEHVPVNRPVDAVPSIRRDGDVTIIPVMEEVIVAERRLMLKEEIYIRRVRVSTHHREPVVLRQQRAVVTRTPHDAPVPEDSLISSIDGNSVKGE